MKISSFFGRKSCLLSTYTVLPFLLYVLKSKAVYTPFFLLIIVSICISLVDVGNARGEHQSYPRSGPQSQEVPPQLGAIDAQIDHVINGRQPKSISNIQDDYILSHGRYWQGLVTHSTPPTAGIPSSADGLDSHPTDQAESWEDENLILVPQDFSLRVDVYQSPSGYGYVVTAWTIIADVTWTRSINVVGPDESLTSAWHIMELQ